MRIAIVNGSPIAVEVLRNVVTSQSRYRVAWTATSGVEAVEKTASDKPDLILMDLFLPGMDGSQTTRRIMKEHPCAVLIVTERMSENAAKVFEAMGSGALDAASTPVIDAAGSISGGEALLGKIATVVKLIGKERLDGGIGAASVDAVTKPTLPMIAIGSSTGGPKALAELVSRLPEKTGVPIVIVQHVDVQFAGGLAEWLSGQTKLKVTLAKSGTRPERNTIHVAGTNDHLVVGPDLAFHYVAEPKNNPYRPSVDAFFHSLVNCWPSKGVAALLTGMGRDGAKGLLALRNAGWHTIAQDQTTSVVYGMPKAAAELDAAAEILPIEKIAGAIMKRIKSKEEL